jgi:K+/H+ antiporter YhaU regulatory subunit KhtT
MKRTLAIDSHVAFQWTQVRTVVAGGLLGLCHTLMAPSSSTLGLSSPSHGTWAWLYGGMSLAMLGAAAVPAKSKRQAVWLVGTVAIGAVVSLLRSQLGDAMVAPAVFLWSLLLAMYLAQGGLSRGQALLTTVWGTLLGVSAQLLPETMESHGLLLNLPLWTSNVLAGGCVGLLVGTATVTRHLVMKVAPVDGELQSLLPPVDATDELAQLVRQALETYQQAASSLEEHPSARSAAEQLVKKIGRFGKRWQDIESQAQKSDRSQLGERKKDLEARVAATTDDSVRSEYARALRAIDEQLAYLDDIAKGRERAIARLHHQVATLERLRLAAVRHRSVGATKLGEDLKSVVDELNQAGQDLDTAAEVLAELPS